MLRLKCNRKSPDLTSNWEMRRTRGFYPHGSEGKISPIIPTKLRGRTGRGWRGLANPAFVGDIALGVIKLKNQANTQTQCSVLINTDSGHTKQMQGGPCGFADGRLVFR